MSKLQPKKHKIISVACTIDNNYVKYAMVMLASLFENNRDQKFHVFLVHNGIEKTNLIKVQRFFEQYNSSLELLDIRPFLVLLPDNIPLTHHITIATYFRFFLPITLPQDLPKVLFLDPDIIIRRNVTPLWDIDISQYSHAAAINPGCREYFSNLIRSQDHFDYFNAGVMLINLERWRMSNVLEKGCKIIEEYGNRLTLWDQDVLNILFKSNWLRISLTWNATNQVFKKCLSPSDLILGENIDDLISNPSIVHFSGAGISKPWHYYCDRPFKDLYKEYLDCTPWRGSKLLEEPSWLMKTRIHLKLGTKVKKMLAFIR